MLATWHQRRAQKRSSIKFADKIKWSVVDDPPGETCSVMHFPGQVEAAEYVYRRKSTGSDRHLTILPPVGK